MEASFAAAHSTIMGKKEWRLDLRPGASARKNAYAISLGFDWNPGDWRVFGEYQRGWDWNFSRDYDTETWQLGLARDFAGAWRLGAMAEGLTIKDPRGKNTVDDFYKLALNIRYNFISGMFLLFEYGHEWQRRRFDGHLAEKRQGNFFGMRLGLRF